MSQFLTELCANLKPGSDKVWILDKPLRYHSDLLGAVIEAPAGFYTDLASVPRIPFIFTLWGNRAHREAIIHDYLYCSDSVPVATKVQADRVFLEAMRVRGKAFYVRWFMFVGVLGFAWMFFHRRKVADPL